MLVVVVVVGSVVVVVINVVVVVVVVSGIVVVVTDVVLVVSGSVVVVVSSGMVVVVVIVVVASGIVDVVVATGYVYSAITLPLLSSRIAVSPSLFHTHVAYPQKRSVSLSTPAPVWTVTDAFAARTKAGKVYVCCARSSRCHPASSTSSPLFFIVTVSGVSGCSPAIEILIFFILQSCGQFSLVSFSSQARFPQHGVFCSCIQV